MAAPNADTIIQRYLKRLEREMGAFPAVHRDEVLDEIREHIADARSAGETDADVLRLLERVGDPKTIAAEARERFDLPPAQPSPADYVAVILLALGASAVAYIAAIYLLWKSASWSLRDKVAGTVLPLLTVPALLIGGFGHPAFTVAALAPIPVAALYLAVRMRHRSGLAGGAFAAGTIALAAIPIVVIGLATATETQSSSSYVYTVTNGQHVCESGTGNGPVSVVPCDSVPPPDGGWQALEASGNATPDATAGTPLP